jgi:hypothetical protein
MGIELSCECGNEDTFEEQTLVKFTVDGEANRERKIIEDTVYKCDNCGKDAEICDV